MCKKVREIDLSMLPKTNNGKSISWKDSVGYTINFVYDDIYGNIEIVDRKKEGLIIKYKDKVFLDEPIKHGGLAKCKIGNYIGVKTSCLEYEVGQVIKNDKKDITITHRQRVRKDDGKISKEYMYICNKCGFNSCDCYVRGEYMSEYWTAETSIRKENLGCPCCSGKIVSIKINSIVATAPWMVKYFQGGYDEAKKYTKRSMVKINPVCPDCGAIKDKKIAIDRIWVEKSIGCNNCGDGFSYPEKFMSSVLNQLNLRFETQYSPDYLGRKRSDFYLPDHNLVIETDGALGHKGGRTLSSQIGECVEIDKWKDEQHKLHGIDTIRINCFESDMEYIKKNILESKLNKLFDLSKVDWLECEYRTTTNKQKEVCEYWNNKNLNDGVRELMNIFGLSKYCITQYLHKGTKLGWCNYDPKEESGRREYRLLRKINKKVGVYKDGMFIGEYPSIKYLSEISESEFGVKLDRSKISSVCNNHIKSHKGYYFKFIKDEEVA